MQVHRILFVLLTIRLLMPPGICACKWNAPAAQLLVSLAGKTTTIPPAPAETDDDHAPGCPASFLSVGMGVWPPSEPLPAPVLSPELLPADNTTNASAYTLLPACGFAWEDSVRPPSAPLYLTQCALLI